MTPAIDAIWALRCEGHCLDTIAEVAGCSRSTVGRLIKAEARRRARCSTSTPTAPPEPVTPAAAPVFTNRLLIPR